MKLAYTHLHSWFLRCDRSTEMTLSKERVFQFFNLHVVETVIQTIVVIIILRFVGRIEPYRRYAIIVGKQTIWLSLEGARALSKKTYTTK